MCGGLVPRKALDGEKQHERARIADCRAADSTKHRGSRMRNGNPLPKIDPLPGSLHFERVRCGKSGCRCAKGELHGPYPYLRWRQGNQQRKAYVAAAQVPAVRAALARWRALHPPLWRIRRELAALRRLGKEASG